MIDTMTKSIMGRKAFISFYSLWFIMKGSQDKSSSRNLRQELKKKPWGNSAYWFVLLAYSVCFFIQPRDTFLEAVLPAVG